MLAIAGVTALLLHGGLLLAIILEQPRQIQAFSSRAAVSLVLQPAGQQQNSAPVAPKPAERPAEQPHTAPAVIANAAAPPPHVISKARPAPGPSAPASQPSPVAQTGTLHQTTGPQGFVSAAPLGGNANQPPAYPDAAIAHGEQGKVLLSIHVLPDGTTDFVSVTQSSGYRVLDQAAQNAVMKWRFQPATMAGKPVVEVIPFCINFDLQTQTARPPQ